MINITLIDATGAYTFTQHMTHTDATDYMETALGDRKRQLVAAFLFDTRAKTLLHYIINGMRAKLVTEAMFQW